VHLGVRENHSVCTKAVTKKEWKKTVLNRCSIFHWQKARNNARQPDIAKLMKGNIISIGCYVWLFLIDFPQTEIAWWNSICYLDQIEQFLVSFSAKNVSRLGLLHMVNWGCFENTLLQCTTCLHTTYHGPMAWLKHYILLCLKNRHFQNGINKPCVHWRDCACLVHKICGYYYYKKEVYVQVIRSIAARYFRGRQHGPAWKCIYPKNKPTINARNHGNLTKRTSELHEIAINSKKRLQCYLFFRRMKERLSFLLKIQGNCRTNVGTTKDIFRGHYT